MALEEPFENIELSGAVQINRRVLRKSNKNFLNNIESSINSEMSAIENFAPGLVGVFSRYALAVENNNTLSDFEKKHNTTSFFAGAAYMNKILVDQYMASNFAVPHIPKEATDAIMETVKTNLRNPKDYNHLHQTMYQRIIAVDEQLGTNIFVYTREFTSLYPSASEIHLLLGAYTAITAHEHTSSAEALNSHYNY